MDGASEQNFFLKEQLRRPCGSFAISEQSVKCTTPNTQMEVVVYYYYHFQQQEE